MSSTVKIHEAGCTCILKDAPPTRPFSWWNAEGDEPSVGDTMVCDQTLQNLKWDDEHMALLSEIPWSF